MAVLTRPVAFLRFRRSIISSIFTLPAVLLFPASGLAEPTEFQQLQSVFAGQSEDAELIWENTIESATELLFTEFNTSKGKYVLSVKRDKCVNAGNVANLLGCPARLAKINAGTTSDFLIKDKIFYFSGEFPAALDAPVRILQTPRNRILLSLDIDNMKLLNRDTNNGVTTVGVENLSRQGEQQ